MVDSTKKRLQKLTFIMVSMGLPAAAHGQQCAPSWEVSGHTYSGFFNFRGFAASPETVVFDDSDRNGVSYMQSQYGSLPGLSYGLAAQAQRVHATGTLLGLQVGYERLRSRTRVVLVQRGPLADVLGSTTGRAHLNNDFLNIHLFAGHRFKLRALDIDLTAGPEVGVLFRSREVGRATDGVRTYTTNLERPQPKLDARVRLNLTTFYKRVGIAAGYAHGLSNYCRDQTVLYYTDEAYSQVWRLGLVYRFGKHQARG